MDKKNYLEKLYYVLLPALIVGIPLGYTSFLVSLIFILPLFFMTTRHTAGVFLLMYSGPLGGIVRTMYPSLPIYGLLLDFIGIMLLWDLIIDLFSKHSREIIGIIVTLAVFGLFYLEGPQDAFSKDKYTTMCTHGLFMLLGYFAFEKSSRIDAEGLARLLLFGSICMMMFTITAYSLKVGGLFDYNWFREENAIYDKANDFEVKMGGYQLVGMLALMGVAVYLSQIKLKPSDTLFYGICSAQLILMSGARQAILGFAIIISLRYFVFRAANLERRKVMGRFLWIVVGMVIAYFAFSLIFQNIGSDILSATLAEGDEGRELRWVTAINIFKDHPFFGAGLGSFHALTGFSWPHNFFLELLCETGIIGFVTSMILLIVPLARKKQGLLHITQSKMFFFLLLMCLFIRVMVSSDLRESIELFSAVFAITSAGYIKKTLSNRIRLFK